VCVVRTPTLLVIRQKTVVETHAKRIMKFVVIVDNLAINKKIAVVQKESKFVAVVLNNVSRMCVATMPTFMTKDRLGKLVVAILVIRWFTTVRVIQILMIMKI
jgi:hypothetical protein